MFTATRVVRDIPRPTSVRYMYKILNPSEFVLPQSTVPWTSNDVSDGFMHASHAEQLALVLKRFYSKAQSVNITKISLVEVEAVGQEVRWEWAGAGKDAEGIALRTEYPHVYAPIPWTEKTVVGVRLLNKESDAEFALDPAFFEL